MKFAFAVVLLALAVGVQSSVLGVGPWGAPWGVGPWGGHAAVDHSAWGAPWGAPLAGHGLWAPGHGAWAGGHGAWAGGHGLWASGPAIPGIALAQGPSIAHAGLGLAHAAHGPGVYVAKTRGAVHTAPLAGHIASATSVNVAPAPGTH